MYEKTVNLSTKADKNTSESVKSNATLNGTTDIIVLYM